MSIGQNGELGWYGARELLGLLGVKAHVLRYWEQSLPIVRPRRDESGHRQWSAAQVRMLLRVRHHVVERGMSVAAAGDALLREAVGDDAAVKSRLEALRGQLVALLIRVRGASEKRVQLDESPRAERYPHGGEHAGSGQQPSHGGEHAGSGQHAVGGQHAPTTPSTSVIRLEQFIADRVIPPPAGGAWRWHRTVRTHTESPSPTIGVHLSDGPQRFARIVLVPEITAVPARKRVSLMQQIVALRDAARASAVPATRYAVADLLPDTDTLSLSAFQWRTARWNAPRAAIFFALATSGVIEGWLQDADAEWLYLWEADDSAAPAAPTREMYHRALCSRVGIAVGATPRTGRAASPSLVLRGSIVLHIPTWRSCSMDVLAHGAWSFGRTERLDLPPFSADAYTIGARYDLWLQDLVRAGASIVLLGSQAKPTPWRGVAWPNEVELIWGVATADATVD